MLRLILVILLAVFPLDTAICEAFHSVPSGTRRFASRLLGVCRYSRRGALLSHYLTRTRALSSAIHFGWEIHDDNRAPQCS